MKAGTEALVFRTGKKNSEQEAQIELVKLRREALACEYLVTMGRPKAKCYAKRNKMIHSHTSGEYTDIYTGI